LVPSSDWIPSAPANCVLINVATLATVTRPPPEPLDYDRTSGRIPSEPRSERIVRIGALAYTRSTKVQLHYFHFSPHHLASGQNQTTHCLPDYRHKPKCERLPIPFLLAPIPSLFHWHPLPLPFTSLLSDIVNQHNRHHTAVVLLFLHLVLVSLFHTNKFPLTSPVFPARGRVPLLPLHRYPRHRHSTYNACIYTCPSARRGGQRSNRKILSSSPFPLCVLDIRLRGTTVYIRLCRRLTLRLRLSPPLFTLSSCFPLCS
jgi:hypothetical protein